MPKLKKRGRKADATGRSKGAQSRHIRIYQHELESDAWRSLNCVERCLYLELLARFNGQNNGEIALSVRDAAEALGVGKDTVKKPFETLLDRGFIKLITDSDFNLKTKGGKAREFELTAKDVGDRKATKEFMKWRAEGTRKLERGPVNPDGVSGESGQSTENCTPKSLACPVNRDSNGRFGASNRPVNPDTYNLPCEAASANANAGDPSSMAANEGAQQGNLLLPIKGGMADASNRWLRDLMNRDPSGEIFAAMPADLQERATAAERHKNGAGLQIIHAWQRSRAA